MAVNLQELLPVSVLMTAYNREAYIAEAIESVLSSDYPYFELIIVDDGSTDHTIEIVKKFEAVDKRIRFYLNKVNLGDYRNRNKAAEYARGKYIMHCDSDDSFFKDTISYCVTNMENNANANFGMYYNEKNKKPLLLSPKETLHNHFFAKPFLVMGPGGTIIKRSFFNEIGGYPVKYGPANDMYFNLKASSQTPLLLLPKLFLNYRKHEGQQQNDLYNYIHCNYRYLDDALQELDMMLNKKEIIFIKNKNKRRFVVNLFNQFRKEKDLKSIYYLWKNAGFNFKNLLQGIFH